MKGTVEIVELDAPSLEGNPLGDPTRRAMPVYLPPGYRDGKERYPVVYFLHGFTGSGTKWVGFPGFGATVPQRIDDLISAGMIPPVIAVFVDGWTAIGGSQWINSEATGRYACVGSSSGGYGSLVAGRDHPDVFAHIASHSGDAYFEYGYLSDLPKAAGAVLKAGGVQEWFNEFWKRSRETKSRNEDHAVLNALAMAAAYSPKKGEPMNIELPFDRETARIKPDVWARWLEHDPVRFIPRSASAFRSLKSVFVDCGVRDEFNLRWGARMVVEELRKVGVAVVHEEFEDGHMGINYRYDRSMLYLAPRLAQT
jgi:S-formylglutathione hydrolase FrmB